MPTPTFNGNASNSWPCRLPSVRQLVGRIGPNALEEYCCKGYLRTDCIASIRLATSHVASRPVEENEDDENENGDEENEDEEEPIVE